MPRATVILTAAVAALGGLLFGYDTSVISGAMLSSGQIFTSPRFRFNQPAITIGIGVAYFVDCALAPSQNWLWMFITAVSPPSRSSSA